MQIGDKIENRYVIKKIISKTEMSWVVVAYDEKRREEVALKYINQDKISRELIKRFEREIEILKKIDHPSIPPIYDWTVKNDEIYYSMKYIKGKNLRDHLYSLSIESKLSIIKELLKTFEEIHKQNIIHRDIKPENIHINPQGHIYILDFGISKILRTELTKLTQTSQFIGTMSYSSPEQLEGQEPTIRSDIYSLGILFYEVLTGELPFKGKTIVEVIQSQTKGYKPLSNDIYPKLQEICYKMLSKNPLARYSSCGEILKIFNTEDITKKVNVFEEENKKKKILSSIKIFGFIFLFIGFIFLGMNMENIKTYISEFTFNNSRKQSEINTITLNEKSTENNLPNLKTEEKKADADITPKTEEKNTDINIAPKTEEKNTNTSNNKESIMYTSAILHIRKEPNINSKTVFIIPSGTKLSVVQTEKQLKSDDGKVYHWFKVSELNGYISGKFLVANPNDIEYIELGLKKSKNIFQIVEGNKGEYILYKQVLYKQVLYKQEIKKNKENKKKYGTYSVQDGHLILNTPNGNTKLCFIKESQFKKCK